MPRRKRKPNSTISDITMPKIVAASRLPTGSSIPFPRVSTFWPVIRTIGGRRDEDLRPGLRSFPVGEYVIIYRLEGEDVLILHVLRGSRDIEALLRP